MPRAKKATKKTEAPKFKQSDIATLTVDIVEVYRNNCISAISEFENLNLDQKREISKVLQTQETLVKNQIMTQVDLMFK